MHYGNYGCLSRWIKMYCRKIRWSRPLRVGVLASLLVGMLMSSQWFHHGNALAQTASLRALWERLFDSEPPEPPRDGSRGDLICLVEPEDSRDQVWSDRPTLVWQGHATAIALYTATDPMEVLWSQSLSEADQMAWLDRGDTNELEQSVYQVTYGGDQELEPGQSYYWKVTVPNQPGEVSIQVMVMAEWEREAIAQEVAMLEEELRQDGLSDDQIVLKQAGYFASQGLWSDFWQMVMKVDEPSDDLKTVMGTTLDIWCSDSTINESME